MSTPAQATQQYTLQFTDNSGNPSAGISVEIFPPGADTSNPNDAIDSGITDSNGYYKTAALYIGLMYSYTTTGSPASGTFYTLPDNLVAIVISPAHASGSYPGTSGGGLTNVPSVIRLGTLLYNYSMDPAGPIGTGASVRSSFQAWGSGGPPAGMHYCDSSLVTVGSPSADNIEFINVPDPNAAITLPPIIGYGMNATFMFNILNMNAAGTYPGSVEFLVNLISGGRIGSKLSGNTPFASAIAFASANADSGSGKVIARAEVKEIILPSSGGVLPTFNFHVQAATDANSLLTGAVARVWLDITLTPLFA